MALIKNAAQMSCSNCQAANPVGSPYCTRCGAPLVKTDYPVVDSTSRFSTPHLKLDEPHFQDSFLTEGQDPILAKSTFERAADILISGETIEYIATANRSMGHLPDCVVVTSKRVMVYKKRTFGKVELDDMFWRDVDGVQLKESRSGVLLIFDSIQGWQIIVENLPKSQAWRLHGTAMKLGERLNGKTGVSSPNLSASAQPTSGEQQAAAPVPPVPAGRPAQVQPPVKASYPSASSVGSRRQLHPSQLTESSTLPTLAVPAQAQVAAFHAPPPADSGMVVFDPQATKPVLRAPADSGPLPANPSNATQPAPAQRVPVQVPQPAQQPQQALVGTSQPEKATSPLLSAQLTPAKTGSGPLSARLGQGGLPSSQPAGHNPGGEPASRSASSASSRDDIVSKMKQLKELLDAELITREEFDAKKVELLSRL